MVASTYGNYTAKGVLETLSTSEKILPKEERFKNIAQDTKIAELVRGKQVGITERRPFGFLNRDEFKEFVSANGGTFDNNLLATGPATPWSSVTPRLRLYTAPSANQRRCPPR